MADQLTERWTHINFASRPWPSGAVLDPSDLSLFVPMGNGVGAPPVALPWGAPPSGSRRFAPYGYHPHGSNPLDGGPITEAAGGRVYFQRSPPPSDFSALLRLLQVSDGTDYAAVLQEAAAPPSPWRTQVRFATGMALEGLFRIPTSADTDRLRKQTLPLHEALWAFIEHFQTEYDKRRYVLEGWLEGDGDWADEALGFGFAVENTYHGVYRIWTRPWLVTK